MHVTHVITTLRIGGAELMLLRLARTLRDRWDVGADVVCLGEGGEVAEALRENGFDVRTLDARPGSLPRAASVLGLVASLRARKPDLIQSWMYHGDLAAALMAPLTGAAPIVWGVRQSTLDAGDMRPVTRRIARVCARLSARVPARTVCCSEVALRTHQAFGYSSRGMVVIPNGFDTDVFRPDPSERERIRRELGIGDEVLIGVIARLHPQKDHATFLAAMARVAESHPSTRYLLCGDGVSRSSEPFASVFSASPQLSDRCLLAGSQGDVPAVLNALDVAVLSSAYGEGFPNVIGEAMACGVPCVVTDVGDAPALVADTGIVVPPRNAAQLAAACVTLIEMGAENRRRLGAAARVRVVDEYGLVRIADRYHELYGEVLAERKRGRAGSRAGAAPSGLSKRQPVPASTERS